MNVKHGRPLAGKYRVDTYLIFDDLTLKYIESKNNLTHSEKISKRVLLTLY